jgi:hypothetical protein
MRRFLYGNFYTAAKFIHSKFIRVKIYTGPNSYGSKFIRSKFILCIMEAYVQSLYSLTGSFVTEPCPI